MTPRTEAELRRLIDHLGNPDAMAQWLAGILTEEERKDGGTTAFKLPIPVVGRDRNDTDRGEIPREEGEGKRRIKTSTRFICEEHASIYESRVT